MPKIKNVCIVCSNFITPYDRRETPDGPVHRGECLKHYDASREANNASQ